MPQFLMDGFLWKKKRDTNKSSVGLVTAKYQKRFFQLSSEDLSYASNAKDLKGGGGRVEVFPLDQVQYVKRSEGVRIVIKLSHRMLKLKADTEDAADLWAQAIEMAREALAEDIYEAGRASATRSNSNRSSNRQLSSLSSMPRSTPFMQQEQHLEQAVRMPPQPVQPKVPLHSQVPTLDVCDSSDDEEVAYRRQQERQKAAARKLHQTQSMPHSWVPPPLEELEEDSLASQIRSSATAREGPPSPRSLLSNPNLVWKSNILKDTSDNDYDPEPLYPRHQINEKIILKPASSVPAAVPNDERLVLEDTNKQQAARAKAIPRRRAEDEQITLEMPVRENGAGGMKDRPSAGSVVLMDQNSLGSVLYVSHDERNTRGSSAGTGGSDGMVLSAPPVGSSSDDNWLEEDFDSSDEDEDAPAQGHKPSVVAHPPFPSKGDVAASRQQAKSPAAPKQMTKPSPRRAIPKPPEVSQQGATPTRRPGPRPTFTAQDPAPNSRAAQKASAHNTPLPKPKTGSRGAEDKLTLSPYEAMKQLVVEEGSEIHRCNPGIIADTNFVEEDWDDEE